MSSPAPPIKKPAQERAFRFRRAIQGRVEGRYRIVAVGEGTIIREFCEDDLGAIIEFSQRAWEPVFGSVRNVLGDNIFLRLHPDWKEGQADAVRSACTNRNGTCSSR